MRKFRQPDLFNSYLQLPTAELIWESIYRIPIYVVHIFYDRGYFIKFSDVLNLLDSGELGMETQQFTNPDGTAASPKQIVKVPYILCKEFGTVSGQTLEPKTFVDKNGKVMTYVTFSGGEVHLSEHHHSRTSKGGVAKQWIGCSAQSIGKSGAGHCYGRSSKLLRF